MSLWKKLIWFGVTALGTGSMAVLALSRGEQISALWIIVAGACALAISYRFYSKWLATKVLVLNDERATPAIVQNDGKDFVPTNCWMVFGHHFAAIAMQAARHVDGDNGERLVVDPVDHLAGDTLDGTREPRAEQRIDHQRSPLEKTESERLDRASPGFRGPRSIALQGAAGAEQPDPDRPARFLQMTRRHEAIAAIVAGAAQDDDGPRPMAALHRLGDRPSRRFHEISPRHAAGDGGSIGLGHLRAAQKDEVFVGSEFAHFGLNGQDARGIGAADRN